MTQAHLLVIDDDERLRILLKKYLTQSGFLVTVAEHPKQAEELLKLFTFDVLVMDVMMPFQNGMDYTKQLRQRGIETPVLMLTAMGTTSDRISGLECGADDYLAKPFDPKELLLRLQNLLKRVPGKNLISFGPFEYDMKTKVLTKEKMPVFLTKVEQDLFSLLMQTPNIVLGREELAQKLKLDLERTVDVQIKRLRQKIESDPKHPRWIQTVRGQGYKLIRI